MFGLSKKKRIQKGGEAFMRGDQYLTQGDFNSALRLYQEALSLLPKDAPIIENLHWSMGEANKGLGRYHEAIDHYVITLSLNSEYLLAYAGRAHCYLRLENYELAKSDFEKALSLDYDHWHKGATEALEKQNLLFQQQVKFENHYGLAMAYNQLKEFDKCVQNLERAYSIQPMPQIKQYISELKHKLSYTDDTVNSLFKEKSASSILVESLNRYTSRNKELYIDTLETEVINNACLYILTKKKNLDPSLAIEADEVHQIALAFTSAAMKLFPDKYKEVHSQVALFSIIQNCEWPGMWTFLKEYFQEKHDISIDEKESVPEYFYSTSHERYENSRFVEKSDVARNIKMLFSADKKDVLISIEPTLSPKPAVLESSDNIGISVYKGLDEDYRFEIHFNRFDSVKEFILERLGVQLKIRYL